MAAAIHNVLDAACKALKADRERFADGPKPELHNPTYLALAIWLGDTMLEHVDATARKELERVLGMARFVATGARLGREDHLHISRLGDAETPSSDSEAVTSGVALETCSAMINDVCGKGSRRAAAAAGRMRGEPFLEQLAAEIRRLEAVTLLQRFEIDPGSKPIAALWRGATGARLTHVIVALKDERFGLIAKTKGRWTWLAGPRDDVLASVPDAQMESAVSAVIGEGAGRPARPAGKATEAEPDVPGSVASLRFNLTAATLGPDGVPWGACSDRLAFWDGAEIRISDDNVGAIQGIAAGPGVVVTWGRVLVAWRNQRPELLRGEADGALVDDEGQIITWRQDEIRFGSKVVRGLPGQRLVLDRAHREVVALASEGVQRFRLDGERGAVLPLGAPLLALSPDGLRIARWRKGAKEKAVAIHEAREGALLRHLSVDSGNIDMVVFAGPNVLVRHHEKKRVSFFDEQGRCTHRVQAKGLATTGSAIDELHPLIRGTVLAFCPFPRGETLLVDATSRLLARWKLDRFYAGGTSFLADNGNTTLFAHCYQGTRSLLF